MKTVFLFTNLNGGRQFVKIATQFAKDDCCQCVVVLSSRNWLKLEGLVLLKYRLKLWLFALRFSLYKNVKVHLSNAINSDSYFGHLTPDDIGIVAGFDQIFGADLIKQFGSLVNFHWSLLPYYRGPVPTYWCLMNNENKTGITLHYLSEGIDKGQIIHQQVEEIDTGEEEWTLRARLWQKACPIFRAWLAHLTEGKQFAGSLVDARSIYKVPVDYKSFP